MSTYDKIAWLPLCGGVSGLGLILSYLVMRRRGLRAGLRGVAWSLLPLAAYLTGSIEMFWKIGTAIGAFATGFAFSPRVWSGIALAGLALVLFVVSGPLRRRSVKGSRARPSTEPAAGQAGALKDKPAAGQLATRSGGTGRSTAAVPAQAPVKARKSKGRNAGDEDDDLGDVADILRRHGIT